MSTVTAAERTLTPRRLNHYAIPTQDMAATHDFWTRVMGCDFVGAFRVEGHLMSTGDMAPTYLHGFYAFTDGSCIAFFELAGGLDVRDDGVPAWAKHLALSVDSREQIAEWLRHLRAEGVDVGDEVDHGGFFYSLYFTDPTSGQRLELTYQAIEFGDDGRDAGLQTLESWTEDKKSGRLT